MSKLINMRFGLMLLILFNGFVMNSQTGFKMEFIQPELNARKYLITLSNSVVFDTVAECPQNYHLIDYYKQSNDSISLIFYDGHYYSYSQYTLNHINNIWTSDSIIVWAAPVWSPDHNINQENKSIEYRLLDFNQVMKISKSKMVIMNLQEQKNRNSKKVSDK